jgi:hypothetical protein
MPQPKPMKRFNRLLHAMVTQPLFGVPKKAAVEVLIARALYGNFSAKALSAYCCQRLTP